MDYRKYFLKEIGEVPRPWAVLERHDREVLSAMFKLRKRATTEGALSRKVKELIIIALQACLRMPPEPYARFHAKAAINAGATPQEIHEAVLAALYLSGLSSYAIYGQAVVEYAERFSKQSRSRRKKHGLATPSP